MNSRVYSTYMEQDPTYKEVHEALLHLLSDGMVEVTNGLDPDDPQCEFMLTAKGKEFCDKKLKTDENWIVETKYLRMLQERRDQDE